MVSVRLQPFGDMRDELLRIREEMDQWVGRSRAAWNRSGPAVNLWEDDQHLFVEFELPGASPEEFEIVVEGGNQLTVKGERHRPDAQGGKWLRQERQFGSFERTLQLPIDVQNDGVHADFHNGVLTIKLPKREEDQPRQIQVQVR